MFIRKELVKKQLNEISKYFIGNPLTKTNNFAPLILQFLSLKILKHFLC